MKRFKNILMASALLCGAFFTACDNNDDKPVFPENQDQAYDMSGFAKGADVSWLTEMEKEGYKFYDAEGNGHECMSLLRDLGMNAIRLRVWVNPDQGWSEEEGFFNPEGWCDKDDVVTKAWRAHNLGYRIMIDFHYSDIWADPGRQEKPAAWADLSFDELKQAVADHTTEVLSAIKARGIDVEWVQVGNETRTGMLKPDGAASSGKTANFAQLVTAGYDAVKTIYPEAKVIVHIDQGNNPNRYIWLFDGLKADGGKWDVIGMSLYPEPDTQDWRQLNNDCIANMKSLIERYNTPVMMCELGIYWNYEEAEEFFTDFMTKAKEIDQCLGVFTWEPQSYGGWKGYHKDLFDDTGKPTSAFNAFKR